MTVAIISEKGRPDYCGIETWRHPRPASLCLSEKGRPDYCGIETCSPQCPPEEHCQSEKGRPDYCGIETHKELFYYSPSEPWKRQTGLLRDWNISDGFFSLYTSRREKGRPDYCGIETIAFVTPTQIYSAWWKRQTGLLRDWNHLCSGLLWSQPWLWKRQTGLLRDWNAFASGAAFILDFSEKGRPDYCGIETLFKNNFGFAVPAVKKADRIIAGLKRILTPVVFPILPNLWKRQTGLLRDWNIIWSPDKNRYIF